MAEYIVCGISRGGSSYRMYSLGTHCIWQSTLYVAFLEGDPLTHGSWWGNIVNRKPPRGGGFLLINIHTYIYIYFSNMRLSICYQNAQVFLKVIISRFLGLYLYQPPKLEWYELLDSFIFKNPAWTNVMFVLLHYICLKLRNKTVLFLLTSPWSTNKTSLFCRI